jgi:alpha-beta hydrolase superfamily lysophospholipase
MTEATVNDWLNDMAEAIEIGRAIGEQVVLIAVSNGAPLALWYAASEHAGDDLAAVVLMSPNLGPRDQTSEVLLWPWAKQIIQLVMGPERGWEGDNAEHERYWTNHYPSEALLPMMGAVKLGREADLAAIDAPMLIIYSQQDEVVNTDKVSAMFSALGRDDVVLLPVEDSDDSGNHVLAGDILSPNTTERLTVAVVDFLNAVLDQG